MRSDDRAEFRRAEAKLKAMRDLARFLDAIYEPGDHGGLRGDLGDATVKIDPMAFFRDTTAEQERPRQRPGATPDQEAERAKPKEPEKPDPMAGA
jgi:hypothetical protein